MKNNLNLLHKRISYWAKKIKVAPKQIRISKMKRKWASCSTKGWVCFNIDLLNKSLKFRDYAIVHELLHLIIPNHGKLFQTLMSAYLPDWKSIIKSV